MPYNLSQAMKLAWTALKARAERPRNLRKALACELRIAHQTLRYAAFYAAKPATFIFDDSRGVHWGG